MVVVRNTTLNIMKLFIIHRFADKRNAKITLKKIASSLSIELKYVFLNSAGGAQWKQEAEKAIKEAEAVIVFNPESCTESNNARWEIETAKGAKKEIIEICPDSTNEAVTSRLKSLFNFEDEFGKCFSPDKQDVFELYKMMVESSDNLIQRRQKTNAFFITAIGSMLAIAGLLTKTGTINSESIGILYGFSVVGLLLCNSWRNLIDNYGKLNTAKYEVILRLEKDLNAQIYAAEWIALGKGLRPKKYRSFTSTEKNVPLYFALLITIITIIAAVWQALGY